MAGPEIKIRSATTADVREMAEVDRASWPISLTTTEEQFACRIAAFSDGQLVAESNGRIVGTASAQRITAEFLNNNSHSYDLITDKNCFAGSHCPDGEIYQLIGVGVLPELRGHQLGRQLVNRQIEQARSLADIRRIIGFTRPVNFHEHLEISIEDYVAKRDADERPFDPVLAFHLEAGARIVSFHRNFRPNDCDAGGYGILIEYPLLDSR